MFRLPRLCQRLNLGRFSTTLSSPSRNIFSASQALYNRILISDPIEDQCVSILENAGYTVDRKENVPVDELLNIIPKYDGLIVRSGTQVTADVLKAGTNLQLIGRAGTGVDNIDVDAATKLGKMVMNTPGGNTQSAAELTISLLMALSRQIPTASNSLKSGKWERKAFKGTELAGKTMGIIGLGQIGRRVANMCQGLGMRTIGYDPILSPDVASENSIELLSLDDLYSQADFISLHTPLTAETRNLFDDETFAKCRDNLRIINCARGGIIDEAALLRALESGKVAGAALDVYETEPPPKSSFDVLNHPNVICTPHLGASTNEAQEKVALDIAQQFVDAFEGTRISGVVNSRVLAQLSLHKELGTYVDLTERLGSLQTQLMKGNLQRIEIRTRGALLKDGTGILTAACLKGVLSNMVTENVNLINAPHLAEEFGVRVREIHQHAPSIYENSVTVVFFTEDGQRKLVGAINKLGVPKIVSIDDNPIDLVPEGNSLIWENQDRPGCVASVAEVCARYGLNISSFSLGRTPVGDRAIGVLGLDGTVAPEAFDELAELDYIHQIASTVLPPIEENPNVTGVSGNAPKRRPGSANFGSGPTKKFPGYDISKLSTMTLGRSHRSKLGLQALQQVIEDQGRLLGIPKDYKIGLVPASDTGAFEMAMWSLLGALPVDVCYWDSFGKGWYSDIVNELKINNVNEFSADYGELPDLSKTNPDNDIVFTWNGTTSGVKVPNADWISDDRTGLTLCDATSAVFAMDMPWEKLDVVTYSWQKALGGEGAHGMIVLSPRAIERLNNYTPDRPIPKIFKLAKNGQFQDGPFKGKVINTPSMLAVEDCRLALEWADKVGGLSGLIHRSRENLSVVEEFVEGHDWISFLAEESDIRSNTSVCLNIDVADDKLSQMLQILEDENVAYDIGSYRDAPNGLRIWCGSTVESADVASLMDWLEYAYNQVQ